jgi:valyl-tRNA synthetase
MSKTKGNVVDPLDAIDTAGADALRFALLNGTSPGNDQKFRSEKLEDARNFANKLWNAARFVAGARPATIAADSERLIPDAAHLGPADRWLLSRTSAAVAAVDLAMPDYAFGEAARILYDAIWSEFCDWGIELAKVRLSDESLPAADREATWWALVESLDVFLRLLHPLMPFVTEALWGALPHRASDPPLLIQARWPGQPGHDEAVEAEVEAVLDLVRGMRNARAEAKVDPATWLPVNVAIPPRLGNTFAALQPAVERLTRARPLRRHLTAEALRAASAAEGGLAVVAGESEGIIRTGAVASDGVDRPRLERELAQAETQLEAARGRLTNETFLAKAPPAVVDGVRVREAELADQVERLQDLLGRD